MARFVAGDIVVLPFPFSDLSQSKRRPALVLTSLLGDDIILCQITSQMVKDQYAISFYVDDMSSGSIRLKSNIRPNRIFTADTSIVLYQLGALSTSKLDEVRVALRKILF